MTTSRGPLDRIFKKIEDTKSKRAAALAERTCMSNITAQGSSAVEQHDYENRETAEESEQERSDGPALSLFHGSVEVPTTHTKITDTIHTENLSASAPSTASKRQTHHVVRLSESL